ncbi:MAG: hypothetical protein KKD86_04305, partial [Bacteroidetes bacterium]|nr:hypothetical protein [Bacteroidota bacterium]
VLCGYKFDEPDSNFSKSLYEKFDSLLEDFSTQNLFTEFAEKPDNNDSLSPEVFQYAEVDPQSRQIHNKAINLMKSDKLTYLSAVQKVLLNN